MSNGKIYPYNNWVTYLRQCHSERTRCRLLWIGSILHDVRFCVGCGDVCDLLALPNRTKHTIILNERTLQVNTEVEIITHRTYMLLYIIIIIICKAHA